MDLFVLFATANVAGELFEAAHQPAVVGELLAGILVGPHVLGWVSAEADVLDVLAELGVVILLFTVGLETSVQALRRVGRLAVSVGVLGVVLPFAAGAGLMFLLGYERLDALFIGAALMATSVEVTARVMRGHRLPVLVSRRPSEGTASIGERVGQAIVASVSDIA